MEECKTVKEDVMILENTVSKAIKMAKKRMKEKIDLEKDKSLSFKEMRKKKLQKIEEKGYDVSDSSAVIHEEDENYIQSAIKSLKKRTEEKKFKRKYAKKKKNENKNEEK
jgi:ferredoxin-fold anticodon binding domain-containing protein